MSSKLFNDGHSYFDQRDRKYLCLFSSVHCRTAVYIGCAFELIWLLLNVVLDAIFYGLHGNEDHTNASGHFSWSMLVFLAAIIVNTVLYFGIRDDKQSCLVPHAVMSLLLLLALFVYTVVLVIILVVLTGPSLAANRKTETSALVPWMIVRLIVTVMMIPLECWLLSVIFTCYRYIRDKREHLALINEPQIIYGAIKDQSIM